MSKEKVKEMTKWIIERYESNVHEDMRDLQFEMLRWALDDLKKYGRWDVFNYPKELKLNLKYSEFSKYI